jgi:4-hydroxybenzoate polyprenyltransferase
VVAVVLSFLPPILGTVSLFYYPGVALADIGFLYSSFLLVRDPNAKTVHSVKTQILLWMLLGLVGFVMGASPVV